MKVSKCPFCGGTHEITYVEHSSGYNRTGFLPDGAEFYRITEARVSPKGMVYKAVYYWKKMGYRIRCKNPDCIAYRMSRVYLKKNDAIKAWNSRPENKEELK